MAFWRTLFEDIASRFPGVQADSVYVDAMALNLVMKPWSYDVMVTENMFGDILSDLIAALVGGMGMAPSGDIGDRHGLFQPAHGTAPDIVAERHADARLSDAATLIDQAVQSVFAQGQIRPFEMGGSHGTASIVDAVVAAVRSPA